MAINDLLGKNLRMLGLGLILSCSGADDGITPAAGGCKYDSECKGNRYCINGECVEGSRNVPGKDTYSSLPDTYNLDTSQNCTSHFKKVCSDGDLYWQDSCKNLENKLDSCNYGCSNGKCNEPINDTVSWGDNYASDSWNDTVSWEDSYIPDSIPDVSSGCSSGEYTCKDGKCIPKSWLCDGVPDCSKEEDEKDCYTPDVTSSGDIFISDVSSGCSSGEYTCKNGECIPKSYVCDGENDCNKGEDEKGCYIPQDIYTPPPSDTFNGCDEYTCNDGSCIPYSWICDGANDCSMGEDESNCEPVCVDECDYEGEPGCSGYGWIECGDYDSDNCLEWSKKNSCGNDATCKDGACHPNDICSVYNNYFLVKDEMEINPPYCCTSGENGGLMCIVKNFAYLSGIVDTSSAYIAWDGQNLWVTDDGNELIHKFNTDGEYLSVINTPFIANPSGGLAFDGQNLWAGDFSQQKLFKLDKNTGNNLGSVNIPITPTGLEWVALTGTFWVSDGNNNKIYSIGKDSIVKKSVNFPGNFAMGLAWNGSHLWAADRDPYVNPPVYKIHQMTLEGKITNSFSSPGDAPTGLTWDGTYMWHTNGGTNIYKLKIN